MDLKVNVILSRSKNEVKLMDVDRTSKIEFYLCSHVSHLFVPNTAFAQGLFV